MALGKQPQQGQPDVVGRSNYYAGNIVYQLLKPLLEIFQGQGLVFDNPPLRSVGKGRLGGNFAGIASKSFSLYVSVSPLPMERGRG